MSGLILAGLGRGLSNAATTYGNTMMRSYEEDRRDAREEAREARKLQAAEAREEQLKQRMISETAAAREGADDIARGRVAGQVQGLGSQVAGDSPVMEREEIERLLKENPEYEQVYRQAGLIKDGMDPRAQRATDQYEAALSAGASSATLQGLEKAKSNVLALIREERAEKRDDESARRFDVSEERRSAADAERFRISQQQADASTTRADTAATRAENRLNLNAIVSTQGQVIRDLGRSPPRIRGATPEQQEAADRKWQESIDKARSIQDLAQDRLNKSFAEPASQASNSGDNTGSSNPGMPRPQTREEVDQLPIGTRYIAPDGTIRTKS
jgi:hypothetical protein